MTLKDFFKTFDLFAEAPNAVPKMRELVMSLAIRGKLSAQKDSDGNATELLVEIAAKKANGKKWSDFRITPLSRDADEWEVPNPGFGPVSAILSSIEMASGSL